MAEQAKTARKTTAKRKPATKRKPAARKTTARKAAPKRSAAKQTNKEFSAIAADAGRNAFLASLGFYGKAFDQAQEQFETLQDRLEKRRKEADKMYKGLVKRGAKVEKEAKKAINDIDLPKIELESLTDRKNLEAQLEKARARFEDLKDSVSFKRAA